VAEEFTIGQGAGSAGLGAVLFLAASTNAMDVYSAVNSSPWTAETVTAGDPSKEKSLRRYCCHAIGQTIFINGVAAYLSGPKLWKYPVAGAFIETAYMTWLYWDAVQRGRKAEGEATSFSDSWQSGNDGLHSVIPMVARPKLAND
jgi:hypothetical protein